MSGGKLFVLSLSLTRQVRLKVTLRERDERLSFMRWMTILSACALEPPLEASSSTSLSPRTGIFVETIGDGLMEDVLSIRYGEETGGVDVVCWVVGEEEGKKTGG